jgi:hypothetical protein
VEDRSGNQLAATVERSFTTAAGGDLIAPTSHTVIPANGAADVPLNTVIAIQVDERINPLSLTAQSFRLYDNNTGQYLTGARSLSADGRTLYFAPDAALEANHLYYAYAGYFEYPTDLAGNSRYWGNWSFTTGAGVDASAPRVSELGIRDGLADVPLNARVQVRFDEALNPECVSGETIWLEDDGGARIAAGLSLSSDRRSIALVPAAPLGPSAGYTLMLDGLCDLGGNVITPASSGFTTAVGADDGGAPRVIEHVPAANATEVGVDTAVQLTFDRPIDASTIHNWQIRGYYSGVAVPGTVSLDATQTRLTFTPSDAFEAETYYRSSLGAWGYAQGLDGTNNQYFNSYFTTAP